MNTMATRLTMLLFVVLISITLTEGEVLVDCCMKVTDKPLPCHRVKSYLLKDASTGCHLEATVLITKRSKLCVPYPTRSTWVKKCISVVDTRGTRH